MKATGPSPDPYTLVVGIDFSELSDLALERGCDLAAARRPSHLHVVYVETAWNSRSQDATSTVETEGGSEAVDLTQVSARLHEHVEQRIELWHEAHSRELPFERLTTHVRFDPAAQAIAQLAVDVDAKLVIVGTHGRQGARRFLLGSVAENTVRLAPCDVLVVRPPDETVPQIEAPCVRCVETRRATNGNELWCEEHRGNRQRQYTKHYTSRRGAHQSGLLIHTA
ncbi:MAG: universal stress protein [Polyangiaceae bacterium]|nr:universal stress protein [Polyangiaceae bacterium]